MVSYFEPLIIAAIGTASKIVNSQQQMNVLDQTKTLAESALQMLYTAKEAGGNPKVRPHQDVYEMDQDVMFITSALTHDDFKTQSTVSVCVCCVCRRLTHRRL